MSNCYITLEDQTQLFVFRGDILFPYFGNWTAHLMIADAESIPAGKCKLTCLDKTFDGMIISQRTGESDGVLYCMIVGGNGNLSNSIPAKSYNYQIQASMPLQDIISEVNESLSTSSSLSFLNKTIPAWSRFAGSASIEISRLVDSIGGVWRFMPDGSIFVGTDNFIPAEPFIYTVTKKDPALANCTLVSESFGPLPGQRFPSDDDIGLQNKKVGACKFSISENKMKSTFWFLEEEGFYTDPVHQGLEFFIKEVMRGVDYLAEYPCEVIIQRADGTVDLIPDDERIPPLTSVPVRVNIPRSKMKVPDKTRGLLVFENGDPQKFAFHLSEMGVGGKKIARVDDKVNCGSLQFTAVANGVITGVYIDADGTTTPFSLNTTIPLSGKIITGWPNLEVGPEV